MCQQAPTVLEHPPRVAEQSLLPREGRSAAMAVAAAVMPHMACAPRTPRPCGAAPEAAGIPAPACPIRRFSYVNHDAAHRLASRGRPVRPPAPAQGPLLGFRLCFRCARDTRIATQTSASPVVAGSRVRGKRWLDQVPPNAASTRQVHQVGRRSVVRTEARGGLGGHRRSACSRPLQDRTPGGRQRVAATRTAEPTVPAGLCSHRTKVAGLPQRPHSRMAG